MLLYGGLRRTFEMRDFSRMQRFLQTAGSLAFNEKPTVTHATEVLLRFAWVHRADPIGNMRVS